MKSITRRTAIVSFLFLVAFAANAFADIGLVQSAAVEGTSVSRVSKSFSGANTAGNLVIAFVRFSGTTQTVRISDTLGNAYYQAARQVQSAGYQTAIFYAANVKGGANMVTATFSGTNNHPYLAIYEYRGLGALDRAASGQGTSTAPKASVIASVPNELVFAGLGLATDASVVVTAGSGYQMRQQDTRVGGSRGATADRIATAAGTYSPTFGVSYSTNWSMVAATFAPVAAAPAPAPVAVSISPASAALKTGATQQFSATVTGTTNTAVTWMVNGVAGGSSATGTVSATGLYTAPATAPSSAVTVTARSAADSTKSASATVNVTAPAPAVAVSISPTSATVQASQSQQFGATVTGTTNTAVTWLVNGVQGGNSTTGTISASGLYTAPSSVPSPSSVTVMARSSADSTKSATATVAITAPLSTGRDWYVYSSGQDTSSCGTAGSPCATINYVNSKVAAGDTVHVSGSFTLNSNTCIKTTTNGAAGKPITYKADPSARINGNAACFYMWYNTANYINIYGFDFTGVQTNSNTDSGTTVILSEGAGGNVDVAYNTIHDLPSGFAAAIDIAPYGSGGYTGAPCSVHDNVFHDLAYNSGLQHGNYALYIACGTNSQVYNNLIYNEGSIGIHCWHGANQVHIYNNTIVNAQFIGIIVGTGDSGAVANAYYDVSNNIVVNSKYGILAEAYSPGSISKSSLFRNNLVYNNQIDWSYNGNSAGSMQSSGFAVTGTVVGDPKFASPSTGNYRLSSGSPAIGKGLDVGITHDLDGNPRPSANGINIGAY